LIRRRLELILIFAALAAIAGAATAYVNHSGWTLYYGDAEAHLNIARRIVDSRRPGYDQIGTVWLPVPHLLMLAFVRNDRLWRSGLAGAIPSSACFVCAGVFLYAAMRRGTQSSAAALATLGLFAFNPNLLYLQATPMTEPVVLAGLMALLYCTVAFRETQSYGAVIGAGLAAIAASLARYEGWFVIPFVALYFLTVGRKRRIGATLLFSCVAVLGPLYWLAHNWWLYANPLEFYDGPYSAMSIYHRALAQNMSTYRGDHDWRAALVYYSAAALLCIGGTAVIIAIAGLAGALRKRVFWPILFAALPPAFYIWSMHSGGTPIFVPSLWPFTSYNLRYSLASLPLIAIAGGCLVLVVAPRWRPWTAVAILLAAAVPWMIRHHPADWACWREARINSTARRAWTQTAAIYLGRDYRPGEGIISSFGDLTGILRTAGIPLHEALDTDDQPEWLADIARPDLFLDEEWAIAIAGDQVATAVQTASSKHGPRYHLVQAVNVKGAPLIEIYRRDE
jgi:Dolichyl-phosphate-mannose-protein mannosyltransferase